MTGGSPFNGMATGAEVGENGSGTAPQDVCSIVKTCKRRVGPTPTESDSVAVIDWERSPLKGLPSQTDSDSPYRVRLTHLELLTNFNNSGGVFHQPEAVSKMKTIFKMVESDSLKIVNIRHTERGNRPSPASQGASPVAFLERSRSFFGDSMTAISFELYTHSYFIGDTPAMAVLSVLDNRGGLVRGENHA